MEATYPAVAKRLLGDWISDPAIPIVTGFLGKVFLLANCFIDFLNEKIAVSTPLEWEFFCKVFQQMLYVYIYIFAPDCRAGDLVQ